MHEWLWRRKNRGNWLYSAHAKSAPTRLRCQGGSYLAVPARARRTRPRARRMLALRDVAALVAQNAPHARPNAKRPGSGHRARVDGSEARDELAAATATVMSQPTRGCDTRQHTPRVASESALSSHPMKTSPGRRIRRTRPVTVAPERCTRSAVHCVCGTRRGRRISACYYPPLGQLDDRVYRTNRRLPDADTTAIARAPAQWALLPPSRWWRGRKRRTTAGEWVGGVSCMAQQRTDSVRRRYRARSCDRRRGASVWNLGCLERLGIDRPTRTRACDIGEFPAVPACA